MFICGKCKEEYDDKRQRECKYCCLVICEFCLTEDGSCEECEENNKQ
jgi:hypothetical protein